MATWLRGAEAVLRFWIDEVGRERWYEVDEALDREVRERFGEAWREAAAGGLGLWLTSPEESLAYLIVTDQFPRNMFRGSAAAFATDAQARAASKGAVEREWDLRIAEPQRQFFYLPLMHSEVLADQDRCVRLFADRMPVVGSEQIVHARAHREQIRRFGRFPGRNAALGRASTPAEAAFLAEGGYPALVKAMTTAG